MSRSALPLLLSVLLWLSCSDSAPLKTAAPLPTVGPYLPLEIGNRWLYESTNPAVMQTVTVEVTDTVTVAGHHYHLLRKADSSGHLWEEVLLRSAGDSLVYRGDPGGEVLYADFTAPVGANWGTDGVFLARVTARDLSFETPLGTFPGCISILQEVSAQMVDEEVGRTFARGVGEVGWSSFGSNCRLVSATIGGRRLP